MYEVTMALGALTFELPALIALVVGLALLGRPGRRLPGSSHGLAVAGLGLTLAATVLGVLSSLVMPVLLSGADDPLGRLRAVVLVTRLVLGLFSGAGLVLMVVALLKARQPVVESVPADGV